MAGKFRIDISEYLSEDYSPQGKSGLTVWLMLALGKSKVGWEKRQKVIQRVLDCPQAGLPKWFDPLFKDLKNEYNLLRGDAKQFYLDKTLEEKFPGCLDVFNAPSSSHPHKRKNPSSPRSHIHSDDETVLNPYPVPTLSLTVTRVSPCDDADYMSSDEPAVKSQMEEQLTEAKAEITRLKRARRVTKRGRKYDLRMENAKKAEITRLKRARRVTKRGRNYDLRMENATLKKSNTELTESLDKLKEDNLKLRKDCNDMSHKYNLLLSQTMTSNDLVSEVKKDDEPITEVMSSNTFTVKVEPLEQTILPLFDYAHRHNDINAALELIKVEALILEQNQNKESGPCLDCKTEEPETNALL